MANTTPHRYLGSRHSFTDQNGNRVFIHEGDVFIPTDEELEAFGDLLEPAPEAEITEPEVVTKNWWQEYATPKGGGWYNVPGQEQPVRGQSAAEDAVQAFLEAQDTEPVTDQQLLAELEPGDFPHHKGGGIYLLPDGEKKKGQEAAEEYMAELESDEDGDDEGGE